MPPSSIAQETLYISAESFSNFIAFVCEEKVSKAVQTIHVAQLSKLQDSNPLIKIPFLAKYLIPK